MTARCLLLAQSGHLTSITLGQSLINHEALDV
jgi:hypothetical protein